MSSINEHTDLIVFQGSKGFGVWCSLVGLRPGIESKEPYASSSSSSSCDQGVVCLRSFLGMVIDGWGPIASISQHESAAVGYAYLGLWLHVVPENNNAVESRGACISVRGAMVV